MLQLTVIASIPLWFYFFIKVVHKYKLLAGEDGINKLYEYSHYLILQIENAQELKQHSNYQKFN